MIWLAIRLWAGRALGATVGVFKANPTLALAIALACLCGVQTWRLSTVKQSLTAARAIIAAGRANVRTLKAEKAAIEARQLANMKRIDDATEPARAAALNAGDVYARAHRIVQCPAQVAPARNASRGVPRATAAAERAEEPAPSIDLVTVSKADFDACTLNTQDLGLAVEWAQGL